MSSPQDTTKSLEDLYSGSINNSLKQHITYNNTVSNISSAIQKIPQYNTLKTGSTIDHELVHVVVNIIEDYVKNDKEKAKVDKKQLAVDALTSVFALKSDEVVSLMNQIQYLYNNNFIKKSIVFRKIYKKIKKVGSYILL
jgi:hypothetical protein